MLLAVFLPVLALAAGSTVKLPDPEGKTHSVGDFLGKGKWTVVAIWSTDCPICRRDMPEMAFFHDAHRPKDAIVLGVSIDGGARKPEIAEFIQDHGLDFENLIGTPMQMAAFGGPFRGTPTYFIFDPKGEFMAQIVGPATQSQMEGYIKTLAAERARKGG